MSALPDSATQLARLAQVRHDLRTPINHISGYCEMLLEDPPAVPWENFVPDLNRIAESGQRLLNLVNSSFDPTRSSSSPTHLAQIQHDLRTPLNHVIGYAEILHEQAIEFGCASVAADLSKIASAGQTLLELIEAHLLRAISHPNPEPSRHHIPWPVIDGLPGHLDPIAAEGDAVLVVDDHPLNREMLQRRLTKQGFEVWIATHGAEALAMLQEKPADLVLLDMIMPGLDGFQVLRQIKANRSLAGMPVIMLSAADEAATAVHCIKMGADDFLPKPCNTTLLLARIESALAKKRLREMRRSDASYFFDQGTLRSGSPSYVERRADRELLEAVMNGEFSYVLTSRQMGKSSLMVRTAAHLREQGIHVVVLDLTALGLNLTPDQWYDGILTRIGRQLRLEDELEAFWTRHGRLGPVQRLFAALREVVLARSAHTLALFIDELDVVRSLPFSTDEFFAAIRESHNMRSEDPVLGRLVFSLLGVASPSDLTRDIRTAPFNIGRRIELEDFTRSEVVSLSAGLRRESGVSARLMDRVFDWTHGHPYLTQRLCRALAEQQEIQTESGVDGLVHELFLSHKAMEADDNLQFVKRWMLSAPEWRPALWRLYRKVLKEPAMIPETIPAELLNLIRLAGVVRFEGDILEIRNRVYSHAFDEEWLVRHESG